MVEGPRSDELNRLTDCRRALGFRSCDGAPIAVHRLINLTGFESFEAGSGVLSGYLPVGLIGRPRRTSIFRPNRFSGFGFWLGKCFSAARAGLSRGSPLGLLSLSLSFGPRSPRSSFSRIVMNVPIRRFKLRAIAMSRSRTRKSYVSSLL
jgi:hypothetical protein